VHRGKGLVAADEQPPAYARLLEELGLEDVGVHRAGGYEALARCLFGSIFATPAEGEKMLVEPSSQRTE
jgi:fructose-bisphosphate aldolase class 1